jgi:hypothetical protein
VSPRTNRLASRLTSPPSRPMIDALRGDDPKLVRSIVTP